jgi:hypothetical protein
MLNSILTVYPAPNVFCDRIQGEDPPHISKFAADRDKNCLPRNFTGYHLFVLYKDFLLDSFAFSHSLLFQHQCRISDNIVDFKHVV